MNRRDALKRTALIMGYAVSASTIAAVMQGCEASGDPDWMPTYLTKDQSDLVAEIAEVILPKTDTPGAKDVFVHRFVDTMFGEFMEEKDKAIFVDGLASVDQASQSAHGKNYVDCSTEEKILFWRELLKALVVIHFSPR